MILKKIKVKNFMPFRGEHEILFSCDKGSSRNVTLIFGDNMRGKTSFLNSIRWGFYGIAFGRHLRVIDKVKLVNSDAADDGDWTLSVVIEFIANDNNYYLQRELKLQDLVARPKKDSDFVEFVGLKKNGEPVRDDLVELELNQIMPEQISRFFLFDGELLQEYEMLLVEENDQGQMIKDAIEKVLGVPALINGRDEIRSLLKKATSRQTKDARKDKSIKALVDEQIELQANADVLDKDKKALEEKLESIISQTDSLRDELNENKEYEALALQIQDLEIKKNNLLEQEENLKIERLQLLKDLWRDVVQPTLDEKVASLSADLYDNESSIQQKGKLAQRIEDLNSLLDHSVCPTCYQDINKNSRSEIETQVSSLQEKLAEIDVGIGRLTEINSAIKSLRDISPSGNKERIKLIERELPKIYIELISLESKHDELKETIKGHEEVDFKFKRELLENKLISRGKIEKDIKGVKVAIDENLKRQKQISKVISESPESKQDLSSKLVSIYGDLDTIFSDSIDRLRDNLKNKVAENATHTFKSITTEETYKSLSINNNYGLTIIDENDRPVGERSAGAEQIVALALIDGLNKSTGKEGPIIMDTPFGRLDPNHRENVLTYLPEMSEQIILLVHEGEIRKEEDLKHLEGRISDVYQINRISSSHSQIVRG